jgi:transcriptional regulator with PAS, ATPase and Fis domain
MDALRATIAAVGRRNCTVLISGESGSGKELVAQHVHAAGPRARGPFVAVDCTALRDTLFESQLFGHVKGAFTGAEQATIGFYRAASGGTLFLDEIGELPLHVQAKLLRCIQEGVVVPLGSVEPVHVDVRIVAATHRDLQQMVRAGTFREDLYYRLNVVRVLVPPLRARREDILPLAEHFLRQQAALYQEPLCMLAEAAAAALAAYDWPGNARELSNAIEHGCAFCAERVIRLGDLPETVRAGASGAGSLLEERVLTLEAAEQLAITRALRASKGNRAKAAQMLHIERHRLYRKIQRYRLEQVVRVAGE